MQHGDVQRTRQYTSVYAGVYIAPPTGVLTVVPVNCNMLLDFGGKSRFSITTVLIYTGFSSAVYNYVGHLLFPNTVEK